MSESSAPLILKVDQALQLAMQLHQDGRLEEAEHVYQEVLKGEPNNSSALHYLGILMVQFGQPEDAIVLIRKALANYPDNPVMHNHLGEAFRVMGRYEDALLEYQHALGLDANCVEVLNNLGVCLSMQGDAEGAIEQFDKALAHEPHYAEAWNNKAVVLESMGELEDAATCYAEAVKNKQGYQDALLGFESVIKRLGTSSKWKKRLKAEMEDSLATYEQLVADNPDVAEPHNDLGVLLSERGRFEDGLAHYRKAVMLQPDFVEAINNIGVALHQLERPAEAIPFYLRALELRADDPQIHCNLGAAYQETMNLEASERELEITLKLRPDYPEALYNLSLLQLTTGRFVEGWKNYVWRASLKDKASALDLIEHPLPQDLTGKRFHIYRNQGIGDEVFFLRFLPELKRRGAWISFRSSAKMQPIIKRLPWLDEVIIKRNPEPTGIDYRISGADVPLAIGVSGWDDIPPSVELPIAPDSLEMVKQRLAAIGSGPYLGVTWRAGTAYTTQFGKERMPFKTLPIEDLAQALKGTSAKILILQRQPERAEIERFAEAVGREVYDFSDLNEDLDGMLALLSLVDDYVGVSNTNMHLMATLGKQGRVLVPTSVLDWRWIDKGSSSPWFPGFTIYRQKGDGSWVQALATLKNDL